MWLLPELGRLCLALPARGALPTLRAVGIIVSEHEIPGMRKIRWKIKATEAKQLNQTECFPGSVCPGTRKNLGKVK